MPESNRENSLVKSLILHTDKEVDLNGLTDEESGVTYIGKAQRLEDGMYTCLAKIGDTHHAVKVYIGVRAPTLSQLRDLLQFGQQLANGYYNLAGMAQMDTESNRASMRKGYEQWDAAYRKISLSPIVVLAEPRPK